MKLNQGRRFELNLRALPELSAGPGRHRKLCIYVSIMCKGTENLQIFVAFAAVGGGVYLRKLL